MVFISHHLDEVMELTDRVTIMRDGHVVKVVNTNEITKDEMINLMAGKKVEKTKRIKRKVSDEIFFEVRILQEKVNLKISAFHVKKGEICVWQAWLEQEEPRYLNVPLELRKRNPAERFYRRQGSKHKISY